MIAFNFRIGTNKNRIIKKNFRIGFVYLFLSALFLSLCPSFFLSHLNLVNQCSQFRWYYRHHYITMSIIWHVYIHPHGPLLSSHNTEQFITFNPGTSLKSCSRWKTETHLTKATFSPLKRFHVELKPAISPKAQRLARRAVQAYRQATTPLRACDVVCLMYTVPH